jgi:hypothetical protein
LSRVRCRSEAFFYGPAKVDKFLYPNYPLVFPDFATQTPENPDFYPTTLLHGVSLTLYAAPTTEGGDRGYEDHGVSVPLPLGFA